MNRPGRKSMDETQNKKRELRLQIPKLIATLSNKELEEKTRIIENRLFEFANFMESKIPLLYISGPNEVNTNGIIRRAYRYKKVVILPLFSKDKSKFKLLRVDNFDTDLRTDAKGFLEPDPEKCKSVPLDCIDIVLVPGIAFDEKGGRVGSGDGSYDRLIPKLPITARKVSLAFECQIVQQVPMASHDRHVDIIITEERIIYKI